MDNAWMLLLRSLASSNIPLAFVFIIGVLRSIQATVAFRVRGFLIALVARSLPDGFVGGARGAGAYRKQRQAQHKTKKMLHRTLMHGAAAAGCG